MRQQLAIAMMANTSRYFDQDSQTDVTGSFNGDAQEERPGEWALTLSQGGDKTQ